MHFRVTLAVLMLDRIWRKDQGGIDDGALSQRQPPIARVNIDQRQDPSRQLVLLQQVTEIANGGFIGYALQA